MFNRYKSLHPDQQVALHTLSTGLVITIGKFVIFFLTDSVAILSDALESIVNIVSALLMFYSLSISKRSPSDHFPYGLGKAEVLSAGFEGLMIVIAAILIISESIQRFIHPADIQELGLGLFLLLALSVIMAVLAFYTYSQGVKLKSSALKADGKHLATDIFTTIGVAIALVIINFTNSPSTPTTWIDPLVAIIFASFILFTGSKLLVESMKELLDISDLDDIKILTTDLQTLQDSGIISSFHNVRIIHSGNFHWIECHITLPGDFSTTKTHAIADVIEKRLVRVIGGEGKCNIHVEPDFKLSDDQYSELKQKIDSIQGISTKNTSASEQSSDSETQTTCFESTPTTTKQNIEETV